MARHTRLARTALVAALLILTGCSGVLGGGGSASTPAETVTPAPTPDIDTERRDSGLDAGVSADGEYPPGVGPDGIVDRSALWRAHRTVLNGTSYTLETIQTTDSVALGPARRTIRVENGSRFLITGGPDDVGLVYVDAAGHYFREYELVDGRVTDVGRVVVAAHDRDPPVLAGSDALTTANGTVARVERDGRVFYRVHVTQLGQWMPTNVENYSMTAYVRPDGLVRTVVLSYDIHGWGDQSRHFERYDYLRVGNTTVTEPDWVTRVERNRSAGTTTATATPTPGSAPEPTPTPAPTPAPDPAAATATG